jgi:hypothetical protein
MRCVGLVAILPLLLAVAPVHADGTKAECIQAADDAQALLRDKKVSNARSALHICVASSCPPVVQKNCSDWLDQADRAQPTIVFGAKDASGNDQVDVRVMVDGRALMDKLDGTAVAVDPGEHVVELSATGYAPVTRKLLVLEAEKGRREVVVLEALASPSAPVSGGVVTPVAPLRAETSRAPARQRLLGLVSGGLGLVGLVVGGVFGGLSLSKESQQEQACGTSSCNNRMGAVTDHSLAITDGAASTAAFIAGGVLVAGGAALYFTAPSNASGPASQAVLAPELGPHGAGVAIAGSF